MGLMPAPSELGRHASSHKPPRSQSAQSSREADEFGSFGMGSLLSYQLLRELGRHASSHKPPRSQSAQSSREAHEFGSSGMGSSLSYRLLRELGRLSSSRQRRFASMCESVTKHKMCPTVYGRPAAPAREATLNHDSEISPERVRAWFGS
jgi:hypothetical protein